MRWEYRIVFLVSDVADEDEYEERLHECMHTLNNLGGEGWELVGLIPHATASRLKKYHALFKREKSG